MFKKRLLAVLSLNNEEIFYASRRMNNKKQLIEVLYERFEGESGSNKEGASIDLLQDSLSKIKEKIKYKPHRLNLIINNEDIIARSCQFPLLNKRELEECIYLEAERNVPYNISEAMVDYSLLGSGETGYNIYLVAVPRSLIKSYCQVIGNEFPMLHRITIRGESIWLLLRNLLQEKEILLLEDYQKEIYLTAGGKNNIFFSRHFPKEQYNKDSSLDLKSFISSADEYLQKEYNKKPIKKILYWSGFNKEYKAIPQEDFSAGHFWVKLELNKLKFFKNLNKAEKSKDNSLSSLNSSSLLPALGMLSSE